MAESLLWADLSPAQTQNLVLHLHEPQGKSALAKTLGVPDFHSNVHQRILLEFYFGVLDFAKQSGFSLEKTSTLLSVFKLNHFLAMKTPFLKVNESFEAFKDLLVRHAVQRPPYSVQIFALHDIEPITQFALNTYYRHFKLYKYAFTEKQLLDLRIKSDGVELAPPIPPLAEAQKVVPEPESEDAPEDGSGAEGAEQPAGDGCEPADGAADGAAGGAADGAAAEARPASDGAGEPEGGEVDSAAKAASGPIVALEEGGEIAPGSLAEMVESTPNVMEPLEKVAIETVKAQMDGLKEDLAKQIKEAQAEVLGRLQEVESRVERRPKSSLKRR